LAVLFPIEIRALARIISLNGGFPCVVGIVVLGVEK